MTCSETEVGSETGVCAASMARRAVWRVGRRCQSSINSRRRFREASIPSPFSVVSARRKRVATTTGVCPTPPIDRSIDRGDCRFRVHRGSHSIPFRARRFRIDFQFHPRFGVPKPDVDGRSHPNSLPLGWVGAFALRWTRRKHGGLLFRQSSVARALTGGILPARRRRSATRTRQVRGEPRFAARPARGPPARKARVVSTNSKRIVRHAEEGALHVGHRAMLPSMVRRYAAARRKQTRSQRLQAR